MSEEEFYSALKRGDLIQARKWLRKMEEKVPRTRTLYLQGVLLERTGDFQEALKRYDMALVMHLSDPSLWLAKARVLSHLGRMDLAKRAAERAVKLSPGSGKAHVLYGNILLKMKQYDPAIKEARAALEIDPESTAALVLHGLLISFRYQDFREALAQFDRALEVDEDCVEAWTNRGIALRQLGDRDGAIYSMHRALKISPSDPTALKMLSSMGLRKKAGTIDLGKEAPAPTEAPEPEAAGEEEPPLEDGIEVLDEGGGTAPEAAAVGAEGIGWGDVSGDRGADWKKQTIELKCPRCGTFFLVKAGTRFSCPSCRLEGEVD
jgi:tetratricopeptide (TPR) repeat protein